MKMNVINKNRYFAQIRQQLAALTSLFLLTLFFSLTSPYFFNLNNFLTIGLQTSVIGIIAIGMTYVIITGGIDLSVGSILALSGMVTGFFMKNGTPLLLSILLGLVAGTACGVINGLFISKAKIPPFISTLGLMMTLRGLALTLTDGQPIFIEAEIYEKISGGKLFGIPNPFIYFLVISIILGFILKRTVIGKKVYAVGSNEEAARLSGVNVVKTKLFVYGLSGFVCAVSGIILSSRLISAQPTEGNGYELEAIAAVVIGGASLSGGVGTVVGTVIGAFIMSTLRNGLNMLNVSGFWQQVAIGIVVLIAVFIDQRRKSVKI